MKRTIFLLTLISGLISASLNATTGKQGNKRLSPETFRAHRQAFITKKAELTTEEAAKFFPVYFELQDKKKKLNDEAWKKMREVKEGNATEEDYKNALTGMYDARIAIDKLEKSYFEKFEKILPYKKIYLIQKAEMSFHRELLKGMKRKGQSWNRHSKDFMHKRGEAYRKRPGNAKRDKVKEPANAPVNTATGV